MALQFEQQVKEMGEVMRGRNVDGVDGYRLGRGRDGNVAGSRSEGLDVVIAPCGGMLSGIATALSGTGITVFDAEPTFEGADDCRRGLEAGKR